MMKAFDTIVVGLGAMGAAALWQLARQGQRVLGIDRFDPPHTMGSTHGETRITRCAVGEGDAYVPLALRSHEIWRELEAETGTDLLTQCGALVLGVPDGGAIHGKDDFVGRTIAVARRHRIPHEVLDAAATMQRWPQMRLRGDEQVYFEPGAGFVRPERCVAAQLAMATRAGATIRTGLVVTGLVRDGEGVVVTAGAERFQAAQAVLSAGAWSPGLLGGAWAPRMRPLRQTVHWFAPAEPQAFTPDRFPVFIWVHGPTEADSFYGFPVAPGGEGVKLGTEQFTVTTDPNTMDRTVTAAEHDAVYRDHVAQHLPGVSPRALRGAGCLYTFTPDGEFLIGRAPENDRVLLVSACSGHGFKHSAAVGEQVAATLA